MGWPGVGKTTIAEKLSKKWGCRYLDSDKWITTKIDLTVKEIFDLCGERGFRKLEADFLFEAHYLNSYIISLGGGAITDNRCIYLLRRSDHLKVIFLNANFEAIKDRIHNDSQIRPNIDKLLDSGNYEKFLKSRLDLYRKYCDYELDTTKLSINEVVKKIEKLCILGKI